MHSLSLRSRILNYCLLVLSWMVTKVLCQGNIGGTYDLGQGRHGERRGDLGPAGIAGITIGAVAVAGALAVTVFFCYYVHQKQQRAEASAYGSATGYRKPPYSA